MIVNSYAAFRYNFTPSATIAADGMRVFPGFTHTFRPFTNFEFAAVAGITMDLAGADDAAPYVDTWHWYLSEPAAATSNNRWQLVRADPGGGATRSGRVTMSLTAAGVALYTASDASIVSALLHQVHLYAWNDDSEEVYWSDLHRCAFAPDSFTPSASVTVT